MNSYPLLSKIDNPDDLKKLNKDQLRLISKEISDYIQDVVSNIGGHYSSPLGVVDLSVALHYVYNSPTDKIIWDVGHQAYAHKIITGRAKEFSRLRKKDGISGFLKINESKHDAFGAGHASTSISSALGFAHARDKDSSNSQVVAIIGDGAMTGGLAYEGLNNLGYYRTQLTIILNDNSHSISKSVGALSHYLTRVVTNPTYNKIRNDIWDISGKLPMSDHIRKILRKTEEGLKGYLTPGALFEELGLRYIGPIDGHDIKEMIHVFKSIKSMNTPVLLHVYTQKGKGSKLAETDAIKYYSMSGKILKSNNAAPDYSKVFGDSVSSIALSEQKLVCVTAAMEIGTGISSFVKKYPERYIDVGIAEEHAVTYAAGLAAGGYKPIVAIYSTFMQRAYDHIFHDVLLQDLPVIFCMDRAGLVGADGPTHHGVFDIAFMRSLPNIIVTAPKDGNELSDLLLTAVQSNKPFSIRYPKTSSMCYDINISPKLLNIGSWEILVQGQKTAILAVGSMVNLVIDSKEIIKNEIAYTPTIVNCRFIKPLDKDCLRDMLNQHSLILTIEEGSLIGGFGSAISEHIHDNNANCKLIRLGIEDKFIEHGSREELLKSVDLTYKKIIYTINKHKDEK